MVETIELTVEEQDLLESVENDEWRTIPNFAEEADRYREYARAAFDDGRFILDSKSRTDIESMLKQTGRRPLNTDD